MANHKSSLKRIRANETRRIRNRYYGKTMRNAVRKFRSLENKSEAAEKLPKLISMIDKLARRTVIHKNKAGNLKSKLTRLVNKMA
ncbi:MAG: 30S ribosomal protein S20 [Bacteroidales bacterium]|nr:30S ribosomal protein S20 [Bacteroidales bacterium]